MHKKTILVDPANNYEIIDDPETMVEEFNSTVTEEHLKMTIQDQIDLNKMFVEAGLLDEVKIH